MRETHTIADLLSSEPPQWGLRGDPHLWRELRGVLADTALPATEAELTALLEAAYLQLVGAPLSADEPIFVAQRFDQGCDTSTIADLSQGFRSVAPYHPIGPEQSIDQSFDCTHVSDLF